MTYGVDFARGVIFIRYINFRHSSPHRTEFLLHLFVGYNIWITVIYRLSKARHQMARRSEPLNVSFTKNNKHHFKIVPPDDVTILTDRIIRI